MLFLQRPIQLIATRSRLAMSLTSITTQNAPAAIGPYSQAIRANGFIFVSGCIPLDPKSMTVVDGGIVEQTTQALHNLGQVLTASGSSINKVVKATVFLKSMNDFTTVNGIYSDFFGAHKPARSAVEV